MVALGRTIEDMRDALEGSKYVENYVQTLTHEIKSPVSAIRGAAELLREEMPAAQRDRFLGNIRAEAAAFRRWSIVCCSSRPRNRARRWRKKSPSIFRRWSAK